MTTLEIKTHLSKISNKNKHHLFAIWLSRQRLESFRTLDLLFALDDEWQVVYNENRKIGFVAAELIANEYLLSLVYG